METPSLGVGWDSGGELHRSAVTNSSSHQRDLALAIPIPFTCIGGEGTIELHYRTLAETRCRRSCWLRADDRHCGSAPMKISSADAVWFAASCRTETVPTSCPPSRKFRPPAIPEGMSAPRSMKVPDGCGCVRLVIRLRTKIPLNCTPSALHFKFGMIV